MRTMGTLRLETLADLKAAPVAEGQVVLLVGATALGDGRGGFYRWAATSTAAVDNQFLNVVASDRSQTGRWLRIFQRARKLASGAILVVNGGVRTLYVDGVTNAAGEVAIYLTEDGTASGTKLFTEVWSTAGEAKMSGPAANDSITGARKSVAADLSSLTYMFTRGNSVTLVLGLLLPGLRAAPTGTAVGLRIEGV